MESEAVAVFIGDAFVRGAIVLLFLAVNAGIESLVLLSGWDYFVYLYSTAKPPIYLGAEVVNNLSGIRLQHR